MKKYVLQYIAITLAIMMLVLACAKSEELQNIEMLYEKAQQSSGETKTEDILEYILALVTYQARIQKENPKNIDLPLLDTAIDFLETAKMNDEDLAENKLVNVNMATLYMLSASYYNKTGDVVQAVFNVDSAFQVFDVLVDIYPNDIFVRGYRGINYSSLPALFEKGAIIDSDFMFVYDEVSKIDINTLDQYTVGVLPTVFDAAVVYYSKQDAPDKVAMFTEILETIKEE